MAFLGLLCQAQVEMVCVEVLSSGQQGHFSWDEAVKGVH